MLWGLRGLPAHFFGKDRQPTLYRSQRFLLKPHSRRKSLTRPPRMKLETRHEPTFQTIRDGPSIL